MDQRQLISAAAGILLSLGAASVHATQIDVENNIVFITCTDQQGNVKKTGSGVIVSEQGHVLTAKHVAKDGLSCRGNIGVAEENTAVRLIPEPGVEFGVDAELLRFIGSRSDYKPAKFCRLTDDLVRKRIFVAGFPGGTKTGVPSYREGVLATARTNTDGILETDGQTVGGMSGGPVYSENLTGLIGTVIGAEFASDGTVAHFGILPVEVYSSFFPGTVRVSFTDEPCYPDEPTVAELQATIAALETQVATLKDRISAADTAIASVETKADTNTEVLETMGDHPERLGKAEGTLTEIEKQFNWSAFITDAGKISIYYDKLFPGELTVEKIGIKITPFYNQKAGDNRIKNIRGNVAMNKRASKERALEAIQTDEISGEFAVPTVIPVNIIANTILVADDIYDEDHAVTDIELGITPIIGDEVGKGVTLRLPISATRWSTIMESVENGS